MKSILAGAGVAALLALGAQSGFAAGASSTGATFVKNAIQGDNAEIKMGQLAEQNGGSQGVKDFGKTLVSDHTTAKSQAEEVAKQMGVTPPASVKPEAQQAYNKLSKMSGASFDREFVQHMVMDHRKDIAEFHAQARAGSGPAADLATKQLPILEKHLQTAEDLQKQSP